MARLFGTDGVRGVANEELTPLLAMQLGQAGAYVLTKKKSISLPLWLAVIQEFPEICWQMH
jgi:phosphomannomutase